MAHKLGLKPHTPDERDIKLSTVYKAQTTLPTTFGTFGLDWQMLGNDVFGDCYEASGGHEVMAEAHPAGRSPEFSKESVLTSYVEYLGIKLSELNEETDEGTDAREGAKFRVKYGIKDVNGHGHKIGKAFTFIEGKSVYQEILSAVYDFGGVTVCVELPKSAEEAFGKAEQGDGEYVWDYVQGSQIAGGHAISGVGAKDGQLVVISWGQEVIMTEAFVEHYLQCVVVYVSGAVLNGEGKSINGFDAPTLRQKLAEIR